MSSECVKLKIEEERTLKVVEGKLDFLVDEALGGASNKGSLRQLGTNLLRLRVMMDKQIMSLMMPPVKNEMSVCAIVEQYSEKLALESICFLAENLMSLCRKLIWSREGDHGGDIGEGAGRHTLGSTRRRICSKTTIREHHTKMTEHCTMV